MGFSFIVLCVLCSILVHVKGLQSKNIPVHTNQNYSNPQKTLVLDCLKCLVLSSLSFLNLCASLYNRRNINIYFHIFNIKYIHSIQSADIQLLLL